MTTPKVGAKRGPAEQLEGPRPADPRGADGAPPLEADAVADGGQPPFVEARGAEDSEDAAATAGVRDDARPEEEDPTR